MAAEPETRHKRARTRSPSYPYLALPEALEKAAILWRAESRHAVSVSVAMQHWGYKAESSTGFSCIAALKKFGLVDEEGVGEHREVKLSNLALTIILDDAESPERTTALRAAALSPRIHEELWERYGADLPSDQSLKRFLVIEKNFNEASVEEFLTEYRASIAFANLTETLPQGVQSLGAKAQGAVQQPTLRFDEAPGLLPSRAEPLHTKVASDSTPVRPLSPERQTSAGPTRTADVHSPPAGSPGRAPLANLPSAERNPPPALHAGPRAAAGLPHPLTDGDIHPPHEATKELLVPLENDQVARVPYPMSEEDFTLFIDTLQLWKRRLVRPRGF